jgi:hypothetical protein
MGLQSDMMAITTVYTALPWLFNISSLKGKDKLIRVLNYLPQHKDL